MNTILSTLIATLTLILVACSGTDDAACQGDHCVCAEGECDQICQEGAPECHIQGLPGSDVDVQCNNNAECHVECSQAASCTVDCGGSLECDVTCPATGCTVTSCVGACDVSCGLLGRATQIGSTATCP